VTATLLRWTHSPSSHRLGADRRKLLVSSRCVGHRATVVGVAARRRAGAGAEGRAQADDPAVHWLLDLAAIREPWCVTPWRPTPRTVRTQLPRHSPRHRRR
jgi:hypothetical protein